MSNDQKRVGAIHPSFPSMERTARQIARHADLIEQFRDLRDCLVGKSAMVVLPGQGCRHDANMFRPVHREEPYFRNRPQFVVLTAGPHNSLTLNVVESRPQGGKLKYSVMRTHNYTLAPQQGVGPGLRLDAKHHVLMTAANNLLQLLINTAAQEPGEFVLPQLVIMTARIKVDERKLQKLAQAIDPDLQALFIKKRREESEIISRGQLFGDAELLYDKEIETGFWNRWAYENYEELLGAEEINPARKVFLAFNPARDLLREAGIREVGVGTLSDKIIADLLPKMRACLPWPELATESNLLDALAAPHKPVDFSIGLDALPSSTIVRAMRAAFPPSSALLQHVTDEELIAAARKPYGPLVVHAYSKMQVFQTEDLNTLPSYASGSFTEAPAQIQPASVTLPLAAEAPEDVASEAVAESMEVAVTE